MYNAGDVKEALPVREIALLPFVMVEVIFIVTILGPIWLLAAPFIEEKLVPIRPWLVVFIATIPLVLFGGATPPYALCFEPLVSYININFPLVVKEVERDTNEQRLLKLWHWQPTAALLNLQHFNEAPIILIFISLVNLKVLV